MTTVIHRDGTFSFNGRDYKALYGGPGWGYEVSTADLWHGTDIETCLTLRELRAELAYREANGYPIYEYQNGDHAMNDGTVITYLSIDN